MRACVFDIETSALEAIGAGVLLCAVVRPVGGRSVTFRADEFKEPYGQEGPLVAAVVFALSKFDLWIGHNVIGFDHPWLKSRALFFGLPEIPRPFLYDTFKAFRRLGYKTTMNGYGKPRASLAHAIDFYGYEQEKNGIYPRHHWEVVWGNDKQRAAAMGDLVNHCQADVRMTERLYQALLPVDYGALIKRAR